MKIAIHSLVLGTALCLGLCAGSALAQDAATAPQSMPEGGEHRGHGGMSPDKQLEHMTKALDLTADQQAQIKPLLEAHQQQAMQLRQDTSISQDDKHTRMQALNTDTHSKIEAVLTDTQKAKFEKMQQHHEGQWQHGGGQPQ